MRKRFLFTVILFPITLTAQHWKREPNTEDNLKEILFRSTITTTYPTAYTIGKGDIQYEISHRFVPSISEGSKANFGIDGPVDMRMALSYGITNDLMISLGRSNLMDNYDLRFKYRFYQSQIEDNYLDLAMQAGVALNTDIPAILNRATFDSDNVQFYAQGIINVMLFDKKFGIGLVPSYLYNSMIYTIEKQYTVTLGTYYQYYFNRMFSFRFEYAPVITGYHGIVTPGESGQSYNSMTFDFDIETGGHVFQLMLTNNLRLNPSQYIVGANDSAGSGKWHFGFGITRAF